MWWLLTAHAASGTPEYVSRLRHERFPSLCKPRMVYKINRWHGLQILPLSMPWAGGTDVKGSLIENA
ncbi:MAG: hypothetical protein AB1648_11480, partial [Pseudomonadota bacterium]